MGPSSNLRRNAGSFIPFGSCEHGIMYCPGARFCLASAARAASSSGNFVKSVRWYRRTMWLIELLMNAPTPASRIGSHSDTVETTALSLTLRTHGASQLDGRRPPATLCGDEAPTDAPLCAARWQRSTFHGATVAAAAPARTRRLDAGIAATS